MEWCKGLEGWITWFLFPTYTCPVKNESKGDSGVLISKLTEGTTPWVWKSWSNAPKKEEEGMSDLQWPLTPVGTAALGSPTGIIALPITDASIMC